MPERKIGDRVYRYDKLPADASLRLLLKLLKVLGPASELLAAIGQPDEGARDAAFVRAVPNFLAQMDEEAVYRMVIDAVKMTRENGMEPSPGVMDLTELLQVAWFALSSEFSSFLAGDVGSMVLASRRLAA